MKQIKWLAAISLGWIVAMTSQAAVSPAVDFDQVRYQGDDAIFAAPLPAGHYQNPIISGFHPDPSITRKGDDYYLANSSFAYAPGVPIWHSKDLVHWQLIGHALTRPSQLNLKNQAISRGVYAPTLRYHDGLFYLITTAVDTSGNFIVTAKDPAGPWSDPIYLPQINGIDPDLFFDDDGKVYIAHNGPPQGKPLYQGHRAIWLWQYDPVKQQVVNKSGRVIVNGGTDLSKQPIWIEGPHLYKIDGWYYLLCAEGGTADNHSEVVFRTKSLHQPFVPFQGNPILTQRDLPADRDNPVTSAGHADMVQTPDGSWWAVFLATRAYDQRFYNTGRETFMLPVSWHNGWPSILPHHTAIPYRPAAPDIPVSNVHSQPTTGNFVWTDNFEGKKLDKQWNTARGFDTGFAHLADGVLAITPRAATLNSLKEPALLVRRQQHQQFQFSATLKLPKQANVSAGVVAMQNKDYFYYLGVRKDGDGYQLFVRKAAGFGPVRVAYQHIEGEPDQTLQLTISGKQQYLNFTASLAGHAAIPIASRLDGKVLSTQRAGGFVGTMLGIYARQEN